MHFVSRKASNLGCEIPGPMPKLKMCRSLIALLGMSRLSFPFGFFHWVKDAHHTTVATNYMVLVHVFISYTTSGLVSQFMGTKPMGHAGKAHVHPANLT